MGSIYHHPETYDLEHSGPQPDIEFFLERVRQLRPRRILDLACGNGRTTFPLAELAQEWGGQVCGIDNCNEMLDAARKADGGGKVIWQKQDVRHLKVPEPFDLAISACASLSHLLTTRDQLAAWRGIHGALKPGGRVVIAEAAPDYPVFSESMQSPNQPVVRLDGDFQQGRRRLIRKRTARYAAHLQQLAVHYFYDLFDGEKAERFVNDYKAHVYFPNELRLLFEATGFEVEHEWGGYDASPPAHDSRALIFQARRI